MPRIVDLQSYSEALERVKLIVGDGLCSNIYVIGREKAVIVDTGVGNHANPIWPQLDAIGVKPENVSGVVVTHAHHDHVSGLFIILEKSSPKVYLHRLDARYVATNINSTLINIDDGDVVETELWPLKVIWTPGHTRGGICLYEKEHRILFSGDTVFPDGYYGRYDGESARREIVNSLSKLAVLDVDILLPGHGMPVFKNASSHIRLAYDNASEGL